MFYKIKMAFNYRIQVLQVCELLNSDLQLVSVQHVRDTCPIETAPEGAKRHLERYPLPPTHTFRKMSRMRQWLGALNLPAASDFSASEDSWLPIPAAASALPNLGLFRAVETEGHSGARREDPASPRRSIPLLGLQNSFSRGVSPPLRTAWTVVPHRLLRPARVLQQESVLGAEPPQGPQRAPQQADCGFTRGRVPRKALHLLVSHQGNFGRQSFHILTVQTRKLRTREVVCFVWERESESRSVVSDSLRPQGQYSPLNSPDQNTGVSGLSLPQGIVPTQGSNQGLLHCRQILYQLSHQGSPVWDYRAGRWQSDLVLRSL